MLVQFCMAHGEDLLVIERQGKIVYRYTIDGTWSLLFKIIRGNWTYTVI